MQEERSYKVYMHINKFNNKKYIGVTKLNPKQRWNYGNGYRSCSLFYKAIKKYGWNNFKHEILFCNLTYKEAEILEICLIKHYKSNNSTFGYNIEAGGNLNKTLTDETRKKLSIAQKKVNRSGKNNPMNNLSKERMEHFRQINTGINNPMYGKGRKIICLENNKIYNTISEASRELNIDRSSIVKNCKNKISRVHNFHFKYIEREE